MRSAAAGRRRGGHHWRRQPVTRSDRPSIGISTSIGVICGSRPSGSGSSGGRCRTVVFWRARATGSDRRRGASPSLGGLIALGGALDHARIARRLQQIANRAARLVLAPAAHLRLILALISRDAVPLAYTLRLLGDRLPCDRDRWTLKRIVLQLESKSARAWRHRRPLR